MKKPLTKLQEDVLKSFFAQPVGKSFFLTGGTALSGFYFLILTERVWKTILFLWQTNFYWKQNPKKVVYLNYERFYFN